VHKMVIALRELNRYREPDPAADQPKAAVGAGA
jgi:hypothetical protein